MSLLAYSLRSFINESLPCWLDCWYVVDLMRKESICFLLVRNIDIKILRKNVVILVYFKATAITVIDFFDLLASFSSTSLGFVVFVLITQRNYHRLNLLFHESHIPWGVDMAWMMWLGKPPKSTSPNPMSHIQFPSLVNHTPPILNNHTHFMLSNTDILCIIIFIHTIHGHHQWLWFWWGIPVLSK